MQYEWVIGVEDPRSDRGKSILAHANIGVGYKIINPQRDRSDNLQYAFKRPTAKARPHHLIPATAMQVIRLEKP